MNGQHISLATVTGSGSTTTVPPRDLENGLTLLMRDVRDVIRLLEAPGPEEPLSGVVARCHASLEQCLESVRERRERDAGAGAGSARDELKRLAVLLATVEPADVAMVMRRIRCVLARFDART